MKIPILACTLKSRHDYFELTWEALNAQNMDTKTEGRGNFFEKDNLSGENQGALLPNQGGRYLTASSLAGDKVVNPAGEHLGEVHEIMLDLVTGTIDYFVIEFGGFLGLGVKYFAIPLRLLKLDAPNKRFVFNQSREVLEKAPGFDMDHWPDTNLHFDEAYSYWRFI